MKAFVLIYKGFLATHLSAFNYVYPSVDITYVSLTSDIAEEYNPISSEQASRTTCDILYLPGGPVPTLSDDVIQKISKLVKIATRVLATEEGTLLLARTGAIDNKTVAISGQLLGAAQQQFPTVRWEHRTFYRSGKFFSADSANLKTLGLLLSASLNGNISDIYPLTSPLGCPPSSHIPPVDNFQPDTETPGQLAARQISASESEPEAVDEAVQFAARVAAYGFVEDANRIMLDLFRSFPNAVDEIPEAVQYGFEFLWSEMGDRPVVPWNQPTSEQLEKWYAQCRGHYPESDQDKKVALETMECMIDLGDVDLQPYSLHAATALALELGRKELVERFIELLAAYTLRTNHPHLWVSLIKWKPLLPYWIRGIIAQKAGTTEANMRSQVDLVITAINEWTGAQTDQQTKTNVRQKELARLSYASLIQLLEPLKQNEDEAVSRPPATSGQISQAEKRLGISLPDDFKEFLRASNGLSYFPILAKPPVRGVESLEWHDAKNLGIDELPIDLGLQFDPDDVQRLPRMGRVLYLCSEGNCDESLWLLEPSQVKAALDARPAEYTVGEEIGWRVVFWIPWIPQLKWYSSFHLYLESVVLEAEESGSDD